MRLRRGLAACGLAVTLGGCGPAISLDAASEGSDAITTSAGPFGPSSGGDGDTAPSGGLDEGLLHDMGTIKLDVAPDVPLPPGVCPPDCQFELNLAWTYDGFASEPPTPLDPEDQVLVLVELDGGVVVAEERQGAVALARLDPYGQELWTFPLALPCDPCRLVELSWHPTGDLLIAGRGVDGMGAPVAVVARVELGAPTLSWATATALSFAPGVAPRAGPVVPNGPDLLLQPVIEGDPVGGEEQLVLLVHDGDGGGVLFDAPVTANGTTGDAAVPRAAYDAAGNLVLTHPIPDGSGGTIGAVLWADPDDGSVLATSQRVEPSLRLAAAPGGRMLTLGQSPGAGELQLRLGSGHLGDPEQWTLSQRVETSTVSSPAMVVDGYGDPHVVVRTAQGHPGRETDVELLVLRWSDQGTLVWKLALPLAFDDVDEPVTLALTPDEDLVLGGFMAGARHVELRVPNCNCG